MGKPLLLAIILSVTFSALSQSNRLDSLITSLQKSTPRNYATIVREIEKELDKTDEPLSPKILRKIQSLSSRLNFKGPQSSAHRLEAISHQKGKRIVEALKSAEKALKVSQEGNLLLEQANNHKVVGDINRQLKRYPLAVSNYLHAAKIFKEQRRPESEALIYYNIADLYYEKKQYTIAEDYLDLSFRIGKETLPARLLISNLNTRSLIYRHRRDYNKSIRYLNAAFQLAKDKKDSAWMGIVQGNLARVYQLKGNHATAIKYFKEEVFYSKKFEMWGNAVISLSRLGETYLKLKDYKSAYAVLNEASVIAEERDKYEALESLYPALSKYYREVRDFEKAYYYQDMFFKVKESLEQRNYTEEIDWLKSLYDLQEKEKKLEILTRNNQLIKEEDKRKNLEILALSILLFFILIASVMLFIRNRQKQKINFLLNQQQRELYEKNEEINRQNEEIKELNNSLERIVQERTEQLQVAMNDLTKQNQNLEQFSYVISHNLRAPIAQIIGLVSIVNKDTIKDPTTLNILNYLEKASHNLDTIVSDLNEILLMKNQLRENKEQVKLDEVTSVVLKSLEAVIQETGASIVINFSEASTLVTVKSYINSILYNLVSNAIKYRSPDRSPEIQLKTAIVDRFICLTVQDNGLGIDFSQVNPSKLFKLYQRMHFHTEGKGMGLFIVKEQVESLNGRIDVESELNKGTTFKIYLPR